MTATLAIWYYQDESSEFSAAVHVFPCQGSAPIWDRAGWPDLNRDSSVNSAAMPLGNDASLSRQTVDHTLAALKDHGTRRPWAGKKIPWCAHRVKVLEPESIACTQPRRCYDPASVVNFVSQAIATTAVENIAQLSKSTENRLNSAIRECIRRSGAVVLQLLHRVVGTPRAIGNRHVSGFVGIPRAIGNLRVPELLLIGSWKGFPQLSLPRCYNSTSENVDPGLLSFDFSTELWETPTPSVTVMCQGLLESPALR